MPPPARRSRTTCIDLVDPDEPFTRRRSGSSARARSIPEIAARGRLPMVVGGTGLYVSALLDGHDYAAQPWSPELRAQPGRGARGRGGLEPLAARLARGSIPTRAARIDLRNPRRVLRALERAEAGGGGAAPSSRARMAGRVALVGIGRPRDVLYRRIDERAAWLFADGLLEEVRALLDAGYGPQLRPMTGHGYREAAAHLAGEWSLEQAIEVTARRTRQYAKRQLTWFRRDPRIVWLAAGDGPADDAACVARGGAACCAAALS